MAPEEVQVLVDASEDNAAARYERQRELAAIVSDAIQHADAMSRLDASLRYAPIPLSDRASAPRTRAA